MCWPRNLLASFPGSQPCTNRAKKMREEPGNEARNLPVSRALPFPRWTHPVSELSVPTEKEPEKRDNNSCINRMGHAAIHTYRLYVHVHTYSQNEERRDIHL